MISCHEEGILTGNPNANAQPRTTGEIGEIEKSFRLAVCNETLIDKKLTVQWQIRGNDGRIISSKTIPVKVPALSSVWLDKVMVPGIALDDEYLSYQLLEGDAPVSEGTVIFSLPKYFHWIDPKLNCKVEGGVITVKASAYAKSVEILNRNQDLVLEDNYFDMNAGEKKIKILSGKPQGLKLRSVYDIR
jgi:beta-mannosidase